MKTVLRMVLLLLTAIVAVSSSGVATSTPKVVAPSKDSVYNFVRTRDSKSETADILRCASRFDLSCVLDRAERMLVERNKRLIAEADNESTSRKKGDESPSVLIDSISSLVSEITEMLFKGGLAGVFRDGKGESAEDTEYEDDDDDDEEEDEDDEEEVAEAKSTSGVATPAAKAAPGARTALNRSLATTAVQRGGKAGFGDPESRGKKKKKKRQKIKTTIKLLVLGVVLFFKLTLLLKVLAAHLQIKFLIIAGLGLLINAARFYLDLKKGHSPQKVIYYEHAQHQHHYENEDEWGGGPPGGGGGGGGYWARSYDKEQQEQQDGKTAQDMAYAAQKQPGSLFSRVEEEAQAPAFSWF